MKRTTSEILPRSKDRSAMARSLRHPFVGATLTSLGALLLGAGCSGASDESGSVEVGHRPSTERRAEASDSETASAEATQNGAAAASDATPDSVLPRAWMKTPWGPRLATYEIKDGFAVTEGDIIIGRADEVVPVPEGADPTPPAFEKGAYLTTGLWPSATVNYSQASVGTLPSAQQTAVSQAMTTWTNATGIKFKALTGTLSGNYISFQTGTGNSCISAVGMVGGKQNITLPSGCGKNEIIHELGHAMGLFHEQVRSDRDKYVAVYQPNVIPANYSQNYTTWDAAGLAGADTPASTTCSIPAYNFDSRMGYRSWDFTANSWPTMLKIADSKVTGPSSRIYKRSGSGTYTSINGTGFSNRKLGYGLFDANATADMFRSDGSWYYSPDTTGGWTKLRTASQSYRKLHNETTLLLGDFDGNGRTDGMITNGTTWQVSWNSTGAFTTLNSDAKLGGVVKNPSDLVAGDFDGDGITDILGASGGNYYVRYGGQGAWSLYVDLSTSLPDPWTVGYGDFNGDNITDIFRVNGTNWELLVVDPVFGSSWEVFNSSVPAGALVQNTTLGAWQDSIALGDFDGDGLTDVIYTVKATCPALPAACSAASMYYAHTALGVFLNPYVDRTASLGSALVPLHFDNFNLNLVHTCKTLSAGSNAGAWRCHAGPDVDGDGITDILSTQLAPVEPATKPTLSAGDIFALCTHYSASLPSCLSTCPVSVP